MQGAQHYRVKRSPRHPLGTCDTTQTQKSFTQSNEPSTRKHSHTTLSADPRTIPQTHNSTHDHMPLILTNDLCTSRLTELQQPIQLHPNNSKQNPTTLKRPSPIQPHTSLPPLPRLLSSPLHSLTQLNQDKYNHKLRLRERDETNDMGKECHQNLRTSRIGAPLPARTPQQPKRNLQH